MPEHTRFISFIRAARACLGWSQGELSRRSGVSIIAIARLETGTARPRNGTINKLVDALTAAGVQVTDNHPNGGYTLTVSGITHELTPEIQKQA